MKKILLQLALVILATTATFAQQTMTFNNGANHPNFTFSGWTGAGGTIYLASLNQANPGLISSPDTFSLISFDVGPFVSGLNYQMTSNLNDTFNYSGATATTHTLNWYGISSIKVIYTTGTGQSFDHDNFVINQKLCSADYTQSGDTLFATPSGNASTIYYWLDCDNGNTLVDTGFTFIPFVPGNYTLAVETGSCTDTAACTPLMTSINTLGDHASVAVYPNPSNSFFNVALEGLNDKTLEVRVSDVIGRTILTKTLDNISDKQVEQINLADYDKGFYILEIYDNNGILVSEKLIKE